jgi:hypothetical protein
VTTAGQAGVASSPAGCSEAVLAAHGFAVKQIVELIQTGLATAKIERMVAGGKPMEVTFVRITEAGRQTLSNSADTLEPCHAMTTQILKRASASRPSGEWG